MTGLYAQEPLFVVTFWWGGLGFGVDPNSIFVKYCTSYAYRELTADEFPIDGGFAYGFLKSLTGFDTTMQIDGFGQVNQLSAEFIDYFGHFRYWMASRNIYTEVMVEVGLYFRDPESTPDEPKKGTIYKIFEGKVREPVSWNEADRTFKCDFVSETWFKNVGFVPYLDNIILQRFVSDPPIFDEEGEQQNIGAGVLVPYIDSERLLLQQNINSETWPQLFGRATDIPLRPIAQVPEFNIEDNVPCQYGWGRHFKGLVREAFVQNEDDLAFFDDAALVIPLDKNNKFFVAIERDYVDYPYQWPADYTPPTPFYQPRVPERSVFLNNYQSMNPVLPYRMMTVDIESEGEIIRCAGYLIDRFFVIPDLAYFNMPLDSNIPCSKVHQSYENPDYILWYDYNSPAAAGQLTPAQLAFAAGPTPTQWIDRPDYEPNLLKLASVKVVVGEEVSSGGSTISYDTYYPDDIDIAIGWYFIYDANVYVVTEILGEHGLRFTPALPDGILIEANAQIDFVPSDTPWLQGQYISFDAHIPKVIKSKTQGTDPSGNPLYINASGNLTTNANDRFGDANSIYNEVISQEDRQFVIYAKVALQVGAKLYLENMLMYNGVAADKILVGPTTTVTTISVVTGNLRLQVQSMDMRVEDKEQITKIINRTGSQRRLQYVVSQHTTQYMQKKYNKIATFYTIKANAVLRIVDWWASHTYVLTTEIGQNKEYLYPETIYPLWYFKVYIETLYAEVNGRPVPIIGPRSGQANELLPTDQYRRNDYFELQPVFLVIPTHRDTEVMHEYYEGIYYPTADSALLKWPDHVSITLYDTPFMLMLQALSANTQQIELKGTACNTLNNDEQIFKAVLENHTAYFYGDVSTLQTTAGEAYDPHGVAFAHQNMGVITESMDARIFLARLAWENAKHIQIRGNHAALVDFFKRYNPMIIFDADNIEAKSIQVEYIGFEDLITQYNAVLTDGSRWVIKSTQPITPYDYVAFWDITVGRDSATWRSKDVEILLNQTFRPDDFNLEVPLLDGYLKLSTTYPQFLAMQKPDPLANYPVEPPAWLQLLSLYPVEWTERTINSVLRWWLHFESRVWTIMTFTTYVDQNNQSFYLRAGDIVAINLEGPTVKMFEDEQPPSDLGAPILESGYPMERIDQTATNFNHDIIKYYTQSEDCSGLALVLATTLDPETWLITVKVLIPRTAEGLF